MPLKTPRIFWLLRFFIRTGAWVALLPLWIGFFGVTSAFTLKRELADLDEFGKEGRAVVVAKHVDEGAKTTKRNFKASSSYYISYRFTPEGENLEINNERKVSRSFYMSSEIGEEFTIWYLTGNADIHELYQGELSRKSGSSVIAGSAIFLFGLGLSFWFCKVVIRVTKARESVTEIVETYVTLRPWWPPLFNRMKYQLKEGEMVGIHRTFVRPMWAYGRLKRGDKTRVALTEEGPYWAKDLFL